MVGASERRVDTGGGRVGQFVVVCTHRRWTVLCGRVRGVSSDHCGDGRGFVRLCNSESRRVWRLSGGLGGFDGSERDAVS
jgi:hypothetical protein